MHSKKQKIDMAGGLDSLPDLALHLILSKVDAEDTARIACASKILRDLASEEALWSRICFQDLGLMSPVDPFGKPSLSFKAAYQIWREAFRMYPWCLVKRVGRCWDRIKTWLTSNFPEAAATLQKGASEADIQQLEKTLDVKLPLDIRILYRFHDGQRMRTNSSLGLIGGYSFARHKLNMHVLPLEEVIRQTKRLVYGLYETQTFVYRRNPLLPTISSKYVVLAASSFFSLSGKWIVLNRTNGKLYVWGLYLTEEEMIPCVPNAIIGDNYQKNHDMLLWLEEHARRLQSGIIKLRVEGNIRSISLFPEDPTVCAVGVSNNVQVRASSVFVPEICKRNRKGDRIYVFTYSIRMSLLAQESITNGMSCSSCQLHEKHWNLCEHDVIDFDGTSMDASRMHPILDSSGREFAFQGFIRQWTTSGYINGSFTFVPGRLTDPKGNPFQVTVLFPTQIPDYVF